METLPTHDTYPDGTIIRAGIKYGGRVEPVTYVFLKVETGSRGYDREVRWYHTGWVNHDRAEPHGGKPYFAGWTELIQWLIDRLRIVETWDVIYPGEVVFGKPERVQVNVTSEQFTARRGDCIDLRRTADGRYEL